MRSWADDYSKIMKKVDKGSCVLVFGTEITIQLKQKNNLGIKKTKALILEIEPGG